MDCPHCQKELPALPCPACELPALPGAAFCHNCGHLLPAPGTEPPKLLTCSLCGHKSLPGVNYCAGCGESMGQGPDAPAADGYEGGERLACADGMCIGIIGADGKCTECGKPYHHHHDE